MERKDEQQKPQDMEKKDQGMRKPGKEEEEKDRTVGNVPDPQGEDMQRKREQP